MAKWHIAPSETFESQWAAFVRQAVNEAKYNQRIALNEAIGRHIAAYGKLDVILVELNGERRAIKLFCNKHADGLWHIRLESMSGEDCGSQADITLSP